MLYAGIDIGGTKCAVVLGKMQDGAFEVISKERFETVTDKPVEMLEILKKSLYNQLNEYGIAELGGIGISCGGPLSSKSGVKNSSTYSGLS